MSIFKLENVIQNYTWGSRTAINQLFDIENPDNAPQAEVWMGAHINGCSRLACSKQLLSEFIDQDKVGTLGESILERFGELPYLFKILAAETPLSIQVHPNKDKAEIGFLRENKNKIPLNAFNRNYQDPNHKPELVYAVTCYKAMNGFRPIEEIIILFKELNLPTLMDDISEFDKFPTIQGLKKFFSSIMNLNGNRKYLALNELYNMYGRAGFSDVLNKALEYSKGFRKYYNNDLGLFSPFLLNIVELEPGEAMFLQAETPHAYINGMALEIMANSDNVLRAGLTSKFIDICELIENTNFQPMNHEDLKCKPIQYDGRDVYSLPVDDFKFDVITLEQEIEQEVTSAEILLCLEDKIKITSKEQSIELSKGESVFITANSLKYKLFGKSKVARTYC